MNMKKTFEEVLLIKNGKNQRAVENPEGMYPIYGSGGIMGYADQYLCEANAVIIGRKGSINKPIFVETPFWNVDTAFGLVADPEYLLPKYLFYFCKYFDFEKLSTTVTIPSLTKANLLKIVIKVPELKQQNEEVQILDKINNIIDLRKAQLIELDNLIKSRFVEMFGDSFTNSKNLPELMWKDVFSTTTGKLDSNAMVEDGQYPFFTCAKESFWIDDYAFDCEALLLAGNNAAGVYDVKHYNGKFNAYQRTYVLQLLNNGWSYILFKQQLEDKLIHLKNQSKGTNTRYLTMGILNDLKFIIPSDDEQKQFALFVQHVDKLKHEVRESLEKTQKLFDSLMQVYFE